MGGVFGQRRGFSLGSLRVLGLRAVWACAWRQETTSSVEARGGARGRGVAVKTRAVSGLLLFFEPVTFDVNDDGS